MIDLAFVDLQQICDTLNVLFACVMVQRDKDQNTLYFLLEGEPG